MKLVARFLSVLLSRFADWSERRSRDTWEAEARDFRAQCKQKDSEIHLLKAEVEFLTAWRDRELARLRKDADIARAASALATAELPERGS